MRAGFLILPLLLYSVMPLVSAESADDYRRSGDNHFFNLEYDEAIADYTQLIRLDPQNPQYYNQLASAELYKELYRLGLLESSALRGDNRFLQQERPRPDPQVKARLGETLAKGRQAAQAALARDPKNQLALYAMGTNYALAGNYEFMVEKAWFAALR